ncbi:MULTISPECIES: glycoside hydrolase family 53 protein [Paenibacillus]|uniref:glycoside hydrolase family 53 protein n=1 Tax=Paenibacillus TaxID=44249 RepID=UPI0022B91204|nr:glycosyl hydrolase 53 family protein [Paenibacillus caseinilyticus]MCZ8520991.1 glycosyl hydrolase 53 family protein [Paenibacillus caseinilyticus]
MYTTMNLRKKVPAVFALVLTFCLLASLGTQSASLPQAEAAAAFAKGSDISWVPGMEAQGKVWYDKNGVKRDILRILKEDYQMNSVRIRVWVNPNMSDYGNGYMNADNAAKLAKRAKDLGLRVMLTLHYSDSWADPGQQNKPAAWKSLTFQGLMDNVWAHTVSVMNTMKSYGVTPEWVQVGNETNNGMLWDDGKASVSMKNYAWLVNTGHNAVKSVSSTTKTVVHLANGYDNATFRWNIGGLISNGAQFDVVAMSLYPTSTDWSTKNTQALANMNDMIASYGKEIMVSEVGMDYTQPAAAKSFVSDIKTKTRGLSNGKGLGVFYWEPEASPGYNGGYNKGAWGTNGRPTAALEGFLN